MMRLLALLAFFATVGADSISTEIQVDDVNLPTVTETVDVAPVVTVPNTGTIHQLYADIPGATGENIPDIVGTERGGIAVRLRTTNGVAVDGDLYKVMGCDDCQSAASVFETTTYIPARRGHADSVAANVSAQSLISSLTGTDTALYDYVGAPGGGNSAGILYVLSYGNEATHGGLVGDLRVAATGALLDGGYVGEVNAVDEKIAAANLAGVDVVFTPSVPEDVTVDIRVGGVDRPVPRSLHQRSGKLLSELRDWTSYMIQGATRTEAMDVIPVEHVGDMFAYLCGAGSADACLLMEDSNSKIAVNGEWSPAATASHESATEDDVLSVVEATA